MTNILSIKDKEYKEAIDVFAKLRISRLFFNDGCEKAVIVLSNIFKYSNNEVCLFTENKANTVSSNQEYVDSVVDFLQRDGKVYLIVRNAIDSSNCFLLYKTLLEYQNELSKKELPERVFIKAANDDFLTNLKLILHSSDVNFAVGDETSLRIETDVNTYNAICNFNDQSSNSQDLTALVKRQFITD